MLHASSVVRRIAIASVLLIPFVVGACEGCEACWGDPFKDVGRKGEDVGFFLATERADQLAAGNAIIGQGGPVGRSGRISLGIRASHVARATPGLAGVTFRGDGQLTASQFPTRSDGAMNVAADFALGLIRGFKVGTTYVAAFDLIGSATYLQGYGENEAHVASSASIGLGGGIRLGVIEETAKLPGVTFALTGRHVPSLSFHSDPIAGTASGESGTFGSDQIRINIQSWRLAASKVIGQFSVTGGIGGDHYSMAGIFNASRTTTSGGGLTVNGTDSRSFEVDRRNIFAGASYNLKGGAVVAEIGRLSPTGDVGYPAATNTFTPSAASRSRAYLSLGARLDLNR